MLSMEYKYKPYIIDANFDNNPSYYDKERWVAGAHIELGDLNGPRYKEPRYFFNRKKEESNSFNCFFSFFVCSPEFQKKPEDGYTKYVDTMLVQKQYDPIIAGKWLLDRVNSIGEVTLPELTNELHKFLETEEWDFDLEMANDTKNRKCLIQKIGSYFRK